MVGEAVGALVQGAVVDAVLAADQGGGVRGAGGPVLEQRVYGRLDGGGEGAEPGLAQFGHGLGVEQVRVVLEAAGEVGAPVVDGDRQVEAGDRVGVQLAGDRGAADGQRAVVQRVQFQQHLAERVAVLGPVVGTLLHDGARDGVEGGLLVAVAVDGHLADVPDQVAEVRPLVDPDAQRQQVDEVADQGVEFGASADADRGAEHQVAQTGPPVEGEREPGEQHHERGGVLAAGQCPDGLGDRAGHREAVERAAERLELGAGPVGGQRRLGGGVAQVFAPVVELPLGGAVLVLPGAVVGVLDREFGKTRGPAGGQ